VDSIGAGKIGRLHFAGDVLDVSFMNRKTRMPRNGNGAAKYCVSKRGDAGDPARADFAVGITN
jgi:hypothetical protein